MAACNGRPDASRDPAAGQAAAGAIAEVSPLGITLEPQVATPEQEERIRAADAALEVVTDDPERLLEAAHAREAVWRYAQANALYTRALELTPDDWRIWLNRGHRRIRLRQLTAAQHDLERAKSLDPYGFNTAYLLGLTYYLQGRFDAAADEYARCIELGQNRLARAAIATATGDPRSCVLSTSDVASRVALTAWAWRAMRRAGRQDQADRLLATVETGLEIPAAANPAYASSPIQPDDNTHYYLTVLYYRGLMTEQALLTSPQIPEAQWSTVAYGVAVKRLIDGDTTGAKQLMREIIAQPYWARLGHVAAEADLLRLGDTRH